MKVYQVTSEVSSTSLYYTSKRAANRDWDSMHSADECAGDVLHHSSVEALLDERDAHIEGALGAIGSLLGHLVHELGEAEIPADVWKWIEAVDDDNRFATYKPLVGQGRERIYTPETHSRFRAR